MSILRYFDGQRWTNDVRRADNRTA
ncbi:DUF2510 domain-containing protein [Mycolicibacterium sp. ND9-15]